MWEWLKKWWDCLDAWWEGRQATSRRARRLRRMQRVIEDELSAQLALHDAALGSEPSAAAPAAPQPENRVPNPTPSSPLPQRRPATCSEEVQTHPPAFSRLTEIRAEPPMPSRITMQPALRSGPDKARAYIPIRSAGASETETPPAALLVRTCALFALMNFTELTVDMPYKEQCACLP